MVMGLHNFHNTYLAMEEKKKKKKEEELWSPFRFFSGRNQSDHEPSPAF